MRVMLANDLPNRAQFLRSAEVWAELPDDFAVAADNREQAGFAAADDDVVRREASITLIEPLVRPDIRGRVDVQPVEAAPRLVEAARGLDGGARIRRKPELVDVVAGYPLPGDLPLWRHLNQTVVSEHHVGEIGRASCRERL